MLRRHSVKEGGDNTLWSMSMTDLVPLLIKSVQELEEMNKKLKSN